MATLIARLAAPYKVALNLNSIGPYPAGLVRLGIQPVFCLVVKSGLYKRDRCGVFQLIVIRKTVHHAATTSD